MKIRYDTQHEIYSQNPRELMPRRSEDAASVLTWREDRIMRLIKPLVNPEFSWLTLGDGNYGSEASWILRNGGRAHASDYSIPRLEVAARNGAIEYFSQQNAEDLTFDDESFDFVLIKEALHHFPRPWLALYESLRVCRKCVILFEPNGQEPGILSNFLRVLRRRPYSFYYGFEKVGNFKYAPNPRELEKMMLGIHLNYTASVFFNDYYGGAESNEAPMEGGTQRQQKLREKVIREIRRRDLLARLRIVPYGKLGYALFKGYDADVMHLLEGAGWTINELPKNPYIK
jgi:ubiquinone/menaquinone biosynthesis C-methylase UbiE